MMRIIVLLMTLAVFLTGCGQEQAAREEKAVNAILKLGGAVTRDEKLPGRPVVGVDLYDTKITDYDLILQRHIGSSNQAACADEVFQVIAIGGLTAWTPARLPSWVRN